jgi:DNA-binding HxlR family transcriptional regulator
VIDADRVDQLDQLVAREVSAEFLPEPIRDLRSAGIVSAEGDAGYTLTTHGLELLRALKPLSNWAKAWARRQAKQAGR